MVGLESRGGRRRRGYDVGWARTVQIGSVDRLCCMIQAQPLGLFSPVGIDDSRSPCESRFHQD